MKNQLYNFALLQAKILVVQRLPTVIRKVKFTDFVEVATSLNLKLTEFCFPANSKVQSLL